MCRSSIWLITLCGNQVKKKINFQSAYVATGNIANANVHSKRIYDEIGCWNFSYLNAPFVRRVREVENLPPAPHTTKYNILQ